MSIKDLLVHVDLTPRCAARLDLATTVARRFEAHLVGLHVQQPPRPPDHVPAELRAALMKLDNEAMERAAQDAKTLFERRTAGTQLSLEWRQATGLVDDTVALHARYADLTVVGQPARDETPVLTDAAIDRIILATGRPALVVPYAGRFETIGTRVLVAWDGSREATRAIADAMPFLTTADSVIVLSINPHRGIRGHGDVPSADMALHLARHGVKVDAMHDIARDISIADVLLSRAADLSADLIVMGAYGHARVLELALGGVTRSLLAHMTVPVLMSH